MDFTGRQISKCVIVLSFYVLLLFIFKMQCMCCQGDECGLFIYLCFVYLRLPAFTCVLPVFFFPLVVKKC